MEFGERVEPKREPLGWPEFRERFLPARSEDKNRTQFGTIRISEGLQREVKKGDKVYRIVNPHELMIETDSSVPCSEVKFGRSLAHREGKKDLGVRPMAAKSVESVQQVRIRRENSASEVDDKNFRAVQWSKKSFPEALWSPAAASDKPEAKMIENVPSGGGAAGAAGHARAGAGSVRRRKVQVLRGAKDDSLGHGSNGAEGSPKSGFPGRGQGQCVADRDSRKPAGAHQTRLESNQPEGDVRQRPNLLPGAAYRGRTGDRL